MQINYNYTQTKIIFYDIAEYLKRFLIDKRIKYEKNLSDEDFLLNYVRAIKKTVQAIPRKVYISKELAKKMDTLNFKTKQNILLEEKKSKDLVLTINTFKKYIESGKNINNHLSTGIWYADKDNIDNLLTSWGITHIHLNSRNVTSKKGMKKNRADFLLFCKILLDRVLFIDVLAHPAKEDFFCMNLLDIAENNAWLELMGFIKININSLEKRLTDRQLYNIYANHGNVPISLGGYNYIPKGMISSSANTYGEIVGLDMFKKFLDGIEKEGVLYKNIHANKDGEIILSFSNNRLFTSLCG